MLEDTVFNVDVVTGRVEVLERVLNIRVSNLRESAVRVSREPGGGNLRG